MIIDETVWNSSVLFLLPFLTLLLVSASQVQVVPQTPYSDGNGSSIAFFITNSNGGMAINSGEFYQILLNDSSRLGLAALVSLMSRRILLGGKGREKQREKQGGEQGIGPKMYGCGYSLAVV